MEPECELELHFLSNAFQNMTDQSIEEAGPWESQKYTHD